jgi:hypothetical protein
MRTGMRVDLGGLRVGNMMEVDVTVGLGISGLIERRSQERWVNDAVSRAF